MPSESKNPRIVYMGTPEFAVPPLEALIKERYQIVGVVTVADKPAGRGRNLKESAVKKCARKHDLNVLQPLNLKNDEFIAALKALNADLFIVVAFRMLPEAVWSIPPFGTFNLHGSLLPKYRGAAPIHWAIINGETKSGLTTFLLDHKIDTGGTLLQIEQNIQPGTTRTIAELVDLYPTICELAGVPSPQHLEGESLLKPLKNPNKTFESVALSQHARHGERYMGKAIRTHRFRYVRWTEMKSGRKVHQELYDHQSDPNETRNVVGQSEYSDQVRQLEQQLVQSFKEE